MIYASSSEPIYQAPQKSGDLAVVTCHFNWNGFTRPRQNLRRFLRQMEAIGASVFGIELALPGHSFQTSGVQGWEQIIVNNHAVMFQKEALINAVVRRLVPTTFQKIAWIDADVWFTNADALKLTSALLDAAPVVQPFTNGIWTDRNGATQYQLPGAAFIRSSDPCVGHPGFAMAARRSLFDCAGGLFPGAITGQGDIHFFAAVSGNNLRHNDLRGLGANHHPYFQWRDSVRAWMKSQGGLTAAVPGDCVHEWHGDRVQRNYIGRHDYISDFDCSRHVTIQPEGWLQWTQQASPGMMAQVAGYFSERKEDG